MCGVRNVTIVGLLQAAALLTIVFSLLTGLGLAYQSIELFSHFRLQYFTAGILLLAIFVCLEQFAYAGALAAISLFNAALILPWYTAATSSVDGTPITLIHANVHSSNTDYESLIRFIQKENPDIFFLQEVTEQWLTATSPLKHDYPYHYAEPRSGHFGIAAFSKLPFDAIKHIDSPPLGHPTILATVTFAGEPISLISTHPSIPVSPALYKSRNEQLASIADLANELPGKVVLMGDFNASIWDQRLRTLEIDSGLKNARSGFGILPTWPTYFAPAMIPIDHVLVSEKITVSDIRTGENIGSDHLPLIVTLNF